MNHNFGEKFILWIVIHRIFITPITYWEYKEALERVLLIQFKIHQSLSKEPDDLLFSYCWFILMSYHDDETTFHFKLKFKKPWRLFPSKFSCLILSVLKTFLSQFARYSFYLSWIDVCLADESSFTNNRKTLIFLLWTQKLFCYILLTSFFQPDLWKKSAFFLTIKMTSIRENKQHFKAILKNFFTAEDFRNIL